MRTDCAIWIILRLVLILGSYKTHGKTCSFFEKKSKQTAYAHRQERCIQRKKCLCFHSLFHLASDWSKFIWKVCNLYIANPKALFKVSVWPMVCRMTVRRDTDSQMWTLRSPPRKIWAFPKRKWRQTAHVRGIAFVPSCHLEQEPGRSKADEGKMLPLPNRYIRSGCI